MAERVRLVIDPVRREERTVELPLSFREPPESARRALALPEFVDLSDPLVAKTVELLHAALQTGPPLRLAVWGGVAHRLRCAASNSTTAGLRRPLHDLDLSCRHGDVPRVRRFFEQAAEEYGSALTIFETSGDRIFNSLGEGRRFRFHDVRGQLGSEVELGTIDLIADEFRFCHRFDIREEVDRAPEHGWTWTPVALLLAKLQYIQRIPAADAALAEGRVLEPFGRNDVLIGPEPKDIMDVLALLADTPIGEGRAEFSVRGWRDRLSRDWGLWRTVTLTLALVARSPILERLPDPIRRPATERIAELQSLAATLAPKRRWTWFGGAWWQDVDALPVVDGAARVSESG